MNLVTRATQIITRPDAEWLAVAAEPATPASIVTGYVVPLAAIAPIASFVGFSVVGIELPFVGTVRVGFVAGVMNALISYALTLVGVVLLAAIVNLLAPTFGARKSWLEALKVTAYSLTPAFLAGILLIFPPLGMLGILASLYGIFLIYKGLPIVMGASKEKAPVYVAGIMGCAIVLGVVFGAVSAAVRVGSYAGAGGFGDTGAGSTDTAAAQSVAASILGGALGGSAANREAAQQEVRAVASAAAQADAADRTGGDDARTAAGFGVLKALVTGGKSVAVVPRAELQTLLPARFADMQRADAESESSTFAGIKGSKASVRFTGVHGTMQIEVSDMGNVGGLASLAGAAANFAESEDNQGYEKNVDVAGQRVHETWKNATKHSELLSMVDSRFAIGVTGRGVDMDTALNAFQTIDLNRLRSIAAQTK